MKDKYIFPAVLEQKDNYINIYFPDIEECFTYADSIEDVMASAKEVLELCLYEREQDNIDIPNPSNILSSDIYGKSVIYVEVWMPPVREKFNNTSVKKTLTIPKWLNDVAVANDINFSQLLQSAIKNKLNIR